MTIAAPYLHHVGRAADHAGLKTSRGLAMFRLEAGVGEFRRNGAPLTLVLGGVADRLGQRVHRSRWSALAAGREDGVCDRGGILRPAAAGFRG